MPFSMTGCGDAVAVDGESTCRVEVRSVNNRFLKVSLRARDGFGLLESRVEGTIRERMRRGAVQVTIDLDGPAAPAARRIDAAQLATYLDQLADFCTARSMPAPTSVDALLALPGTLVESAPSQETVEAAWPLVRRALDAALDGLDRMRRAEGTTTAREMLSLCAAAREVAERIGRRVPAVLEEHRQRLSERVGRVLESHGVDLAPGDLAREIALLADRSDIAEELVRFGSHVDQFARLLGEDSPGRSLDFLSQELAREANTIGSKSSDVEIAHAVVELKTLVERIREQVQNLE